MLDNTSGKGTLFLVSGPHGAGKNAVIEGARHRLAGDDRFVFPLRTISRPGGVGGEIHVAVTPAQFDRLRRRGSFSLCWGAGGLNYAIPTTIDSDLAKGRAVVVNMASGALDLARARYPGALVVWVTASPETCRRRLLACGRASAAKIEARLGEEVPAGEDVEVLVNEGALESAVDAIVALLRERTGVLQAKRPDRSEESVARPL